MAAPPSAPTGVSIGDHALLSDCNSLALVTRSGTIDWLCMPRFDAAALFARLLDPGAGAWSLAPLQPYRAHRRYVPGTLVHEVVFADGNGSARLTDALVVGPTDDGHRLGRDAPHVLVREIQGIDGRMTLRSELAMRPEYGLVRPLLRRQDGHLVLEGGGSVVTVSDDGLHEIDGTDARGTFTVSRGQRRALSLQHRPFGARPAPMLAPHERVAHLGATVQAWNTWSDVHQEYTGPWQAEVALSARVLQGLTYQPTGALAAAATTSLPEAEGGTRNWDYRYSWIRDTGHTFDAIGVAACAEEADVFFRFLVGAALTRMRADGHLQIMFGVGGEHDLTERVLAHLAGWHNTGPVRVGNDAWRQRQLDAYGEMIDAAFELGDTIEITPSARELLVWCADQAAHLWDEKDEGIWEMRCEPRSFVHSKLMCWVAVDRALRLVDALDAHDHAPAWEQARDDIRTVILTDGWNPDGGWFRQALENDALDAANLLIPLQGLLPADDPRVLSNLDATGRHLTDERGLVFRYQNDDGLVGREGPFLLCTFWLAEAYARSGRLDDARRTFQGALRHANDLGLMSEMVHPDRDTAAGNFPQAFSHVGLIHAALAIHAAESGHELRFPHRHALLFT